MPKKILQVKNYSRVGQIWPFKLGINILKLLKFISSFLIDCNAANPDNERWFHKKCVKSTEDGTAVYCPFCNIELLVVLPSQVPSANTKTTTKRLRRSLSCNDLHPPQES